MRRALRNWRLGWMVIVPVLMAMFFTIDRGARAATRGEPADDSNRHANVLGLDTVIAFYGAYPELKSQTFTRGGNWKQ